MPDVSTTSQHEGHEAVEMPELPMPAEVDDDHACYNCDWFRFIEELPDDDDGIAIGHCWALPMKAQVKAAWSACHFWKRRKEDLH